MRKARLRVLSINIVFGFIDILYDLYTNLFRAILIKLSGINSLSEDIFFSSNSKIVSSMTANHFIKFKKSIKDITSFNYYTKKASQEFFEKPDSIINRNELIQYFKNKYYGKAIFIFTAKWLLIFFCRYFQIFVFKEYNCIDKEGEENSYHWICGNNTCKVEEFLYTKIIRIIYFVIFDLCSLIYEIYFLITLRKVRWPPAIAYNIQIVEFLLLIGLFGSSFLNKGKCINLQKYLFIKSKDYYDLLFNYILDIIQKFTK